MDKKSPSNVKLFHGNGDVRLEFSGNPALIDIRYRGDASLHKHLGRKWVMRSNNGRIIIIPKTTTPLVDGSILFKYRGEFKPTSCKVVGWEQETAQAILKPENIHLWDIVSAKWEDLTLKYVDLKKNYRKGSPKDRKSTRSGVRSGSGGGSGGY